ncbi:MAG: ATP synthase F1 subunit epsilon [Magnetococcales bacterium]|nr:ATP synthase F1 subunit epsilon [Magnetococcales bacterium]
MAATFELEMVTPERLLFTQAAKIVTVPGQEGVFGVMPGHTRFLTALRPGPVIIGEGDQAIRYAVAGGYAEVLPERVTLLVDQALEQSRITLEAAQKMVQTAEMALGGLSQEHPDYARAQANLDYAQTCLNLVR